MNRKIKPMGPWVLVKPRPFVRETSGGILLPEGNTAEVLGYATAVVEAVGPGKPKFVKGRGKVHMHSGLEPGNIVYFRGFIKDANKVNPHIISDNSCLLHQDDILGVVED